MVDKKQIINGKQASLRFDWQVATTTDYGLHSDYVEAAAFAWLAYCRVHKVAF